MKNILTLFIALFGLQLQAQILEDISIEETLNLIEENAENPAFTILDVRTEEEYLPAHIENAFNYDYYAADFEAQMDSLNKEERIYLIYCASGGRSGATLTLMGDLGFQTVYNMLGGMNAWNNANYPTTTEIPEPIDLNAPLEEEPNPETNITELAENELQFYPNPASDFIEIKSNSITKNLKIFDVEGKLVKQVSFQNSNSVNIRDLANGNYFIQFLDAKNQVIQTKSFIKIQP